MSFLKLKNLTAVFVLGLAFVSFPIYAQTNTEPEAEVSLSSEADREASIICKRAQLKLTRYLEGLNEAKDQQLNLNRTTLAFVNNIALRLEHNEQADKSLLSDDATELNDLITEQEISYARLQSDLRSAAGASCTTSDDVDNLRQQVSDIRDAVDDINELQIDFEDYVNDTLLVNLADVRSELDEVTQAEPNS